MSESQKPIWNSLEVAKLAVSAMTPILVCILGVSINSSIKTVDLRREIYKEVGSSLNDIYCYTAFIGQWKELTPLDVLARKRRVDAAIYTYKPFFSKALLTAYNNYMEASFATYGEAGSDAQIQSAVVTADGDRTRHSLRSWDPLWEKRFTQKENRAQQQITYDAFIGQLAKDLNL